MAFKNTLTQKAEDIGIKSLNKLNLPNALLIIPDGNRRWAKNLGFSIYEGHKKGAEVFAKILDTFLKLNIEVLGAWSFSEDNWKRPQDEIDRIMEVIESVIIGNLQKLMTNNIKFVVLGNKDKIKNYPSLLKTIESAVAKTSENNGKILALFVDYGERFALESFAKARQEYKNLDTYALLSKVNENLPLFDMVLRTSGEQRMSGFGPLASLAEFVSVKKNLPELENIDIVNALREFSKRQRRLGGR